jgi:hypothetical protein
LFLFRVMQLLSNASGDYKKAGGMSAASSQRGGSGYSKQQHFSGGEENDFSASEQEISGSHILEDYDYTTNALPPAGAAGLGVSTKAKASEKRHSAW